MEPNGTNDNRVLSVLCRNGCGFYGSIAYEGLCSKCYADVEKSRHETARAEKMSEQMSSGIESSSSRVHVSETDNQSEVSREVCEALRRASISERNARSTSSSPATSQVDTTTSESAANCSTSAANAAAACAAACAAATLVECNTIEINTADNAASASTNTEEADSSSCEGKTKKRNRCHTCNKRVGLTGFPCRCGGLYCSLHRYSDKHDCTFNYKELAQEDIRKNNPVVICEKIKKI